MPTGTYNNITAESIPVLDEWGYGDYWGCQDWMKWHGLMKAKYGLEIANYQFITYWSKQTFGASPLDCRSFNSSFIAYAKQNGFYNALYDGLAVLVKPFGWGTTIINAGGNVIDNITDTTNNLTGLLKYFLPAALIAGTIYVAKEYIVKPQKKATNENK